MVGVEHKNDCANMILDYNAEIIKERDKYKAELERLRDVVCSEDVESIDRTLGDTILTSQLKQLQVDVDTGKISEGHVCKHGIRYPHECQPCADDAWKRHSIEEKLKKENNG